MRVRRFARPAVWISASRSPASTPPAAAGGVDSEVDDGGAVLQLVADDVELAGEVERLVDELYRGAIDAFHTEAFSLPH
jgi:hypothetical protein